MKLVEGRITAIARDSRGILHLHFRRGLRVYELWAVDQIATALEEWYSIYGPAHEYMGNPVYLRFNEITDEIIEMINT